MQCWTTFQTVTSFSSLQACRILYRSTPAKDSQNFKEPLPQEPAPHLAVKQEALMDVQAVAEPELEDAQHRQDYAVDESFQDTHVDTCGPFEGPEKGPDEAWAEAPAEASEAAPQSRNLVAPEAELSSPPSPDEGLAGEEGEDEIVPVPETVPPKPLTTAAINARLYRIFKPRKNGEFVVSQEWVKLWNDTEGEGRQKIQSLFERSGYERVLWL